MKITVFIALILLVSSCTPAIERMEKPNDLIEKEKMVSILTELMKLEGHVSSKHTQLTKYYKVISNSGDSLLRARGCTPQQFQTSMDYYAYQQTDLRKMYSQVLDRLNKEMADLEKNASVVEKKDD